MDERPAVTEMKKAPLGFSSHAAFMHSRLIATALLALSVGSVLAILSGPALSNVPARRGLQCFSMAIPAISLHLLALSTAEHRPFTAGCVIKAITTAGMVAAVLGFGCAVWSLLPSAGIIYAVTTVICVVFAQRAEKRGQALK